MEKIAAAAKPVLPPISGAPRAESSASTDDDELSEKILAARMAVVALRQAGNDFVTNPSEYTLFVTNLVKTFHNDKVNRIPIFAAYLLEGFGELCIQTWAMLGFRDSVQFTKLDKKQRLALGNWIYVHSLVLAGTDTGDSDVMGRLVACGIITFSIELLATDLFHPSKNSQEQSMICLNLLGTLYNVAKKWDRGVETIRSVQGSDREVAKYTSNGDPALKTMATIVLTFLLSEDEQKRMLESTEANIRYMIHILDDCLKSKDQDHIGQFGYSAVEIMDSLTRMAVADVNKEKIVSGGALPHYAKVLDGSGSYSTHEQEEACKGLWTLAFSPKNKVKIAADAGCMQGLRQAATSSQTPVRKAAEGALWVIEGEANHVKSLAAASDKDKSTAAIAGGHIMLSYNWAVKPQVIRIKDDLKAAGYRVWIDIENMSGSTLEAMSKAVEDAWLVLIFFTEKYKQSAPCRLEAEYTYNRGKKFIPIKMEGGYKPDGWLGLLLASKLFFDFTKDGQWEMMFDGLCAEINRMMLDESSDRIDGKTTDPTAPAVYNGSSDAVAGAPTHPALLHPKTSYAVLAANSWQEQDVKQWLTENKLHGYIQKFSGLSGQHVIALRRLMDSAPEFFYQTLKQDLSFVFLDLLTFSNMLQALR